MRIKIACLFALFLFTTSYSLAQQPRDRTSLEKEITALRGRLKVVEESYLSPSAEDRAAFPNYLNIANKGLIRLLPREDYDNSDRLTVRGGGAYYSFSRLTHEYGFGSDIELQNGNLSVGFAGADYGMIFSLSEQALEEIQMDSPGVINLTKYESALLLSEARKEQQRAAQGYDISGITYQRQARAVVNNTYIIRSINYGVSDVLVAFRVVRKDTDGSLIIAWKMLKKYEVPQLIQQAENN